MPKLIKIATKDIAYAGVPQEVTIIFNMGLLDEDTRISWAGIRLYSLRPCKKEILISKTNIFDSGLLEAGVYRRKKNLTISNRVVPTIVDRDITYFVRGSLTIKRKDGSEENFFDDKKIEILPTDKPEKKARPVSLQIKNIKVESDKDLYKEGEIIKLTYEVDDVEKLIIRLIKDFDISCSCPDYKKCIYIKPKPSKVLLTKNLKNPPSSDSIKLKIPNSLESSHSWKWIGSSKSYFEYSIGDKISYKIEILAINTKKEELNVQIPIIIIKEPKEEIFMGEKEKFGSKPFEKVFSPDKIHISQCEVKGNKINFKMKNKSNKDLEGVSITIKGIQETLFETPSWVVGKKNWKAGETIDVLYEGHTENIENYQFLIETNSGIRVKKILKF
ncbi:MAG: hypothetical protein EU550_02415 [Promethearchaeota archaeon]|nr:MAG: hypothetical protein EU550_02415 [Candidatus Lokiarchaeota archaeon]